MLKLSVVIPAYNEETNLEKEVLNEVVDFLRNVGYQYEVIVVDDGSTDRTKEFVKKFIKGKKNFRLIENEHGGKALAVMTGLLATKGEVALFTDMDQATPLPEVENFFPKFEEGFDIVIGSRSGRKGAPFIRKLAAWGFALSRNIVLGLPFKDTQCGFKAFNKRSRIAIFPKMKERWEKNRAEGAAVHAGFDVETLFIARKMGLKIAEVPTEWHFVGTERVQLVRDAIDAIRDMLRIRWNEIVGKY